MLRQALAEPERKPVEEITSALIGELLAADDQAGALAVALEMMETAPEAAASGLHLLTPLLRPALLAPVADRLSPPRWAGLLSSGRLGRQGRRELLAFLATAQLARRDFAAAVELLERTEPASDDDAGLRELLGEGYLGLRKPQPALAAFTAAEELLGPDAPAALRQRISAHIALLDEQMGRPEQALRRLGSMSPSDPDAAAEWLAIKSLCLLQLGDTNAAEAAYAAAQDRPGLLLVAKAGVYLRLAAHDYEAAISAADAGMAANPEAQILAFLRFQATVEAGEDPAHVERRLARFVGRLDPAERDEYAAASSRLRPHGDAALHYFLSVLALATGQPDRALTEIELAMPGSGQLAVPVRRLRAMLLESGRPAEAAAEYAMAGQLAYRRGDWELAVELIERAAAHGDLDQVSRWFLAEARVVASVVPGVPKDLSMQRVQQAVSEWQAAFDREPPRQGLEWVYVARARMSLQLARIEPDPRQRACEALIFCERFYAVSEGATSFFNFYWQAARILGLYGLYNQLLLAAPGKFKIQNLTKLLTSAMNTRDLTLLSDVLPQVAEALGTSAATSEARVLLLAGDASAALAVLDHGAQDERLKTMRLWLRARCHWLLGDRASFAADVAEAVEADVSSTAPADHARQQSAGQSVLMPWMYLYAGEASRAADLLEGVAPQDSWIADVTAERALCSLAMGDVAAAEPVLSRFLAENRSFEDLEFMAGALDVLRWKYAPEAAGPLSAAIDRLAGLARARLADDHWPADTRGDLEYLRTSPWSPGGTTARTAVQAVLARLALEQGDWQVAISSYRALLQPPQLFPDAEGCLARVAVLLRRALAKDGDGRLASAPEWLAEAVAELRRDPHRRIGSRPLEVYLGDIRMDLGDAAGTAECYDAALTLLGDRAESAYVAARRYVAMVLLGQPDADASLEAAARIAARSGRPLAATLTQAADELAGSEDQWQQLIGAWAAGRGPAAHRNASPASAGPAGATEEWDLGRDVEVASVAARESLAKVLSQQGRLSEAAAEYRAVVAARQRLLGGDDTTTLSARQGLAQVLGLQNQLDEAEAEFRAVLAARQRLAGDDDTATMVVRYMLAYVLEQAGRYGEAEAGYRAVLDTAIRTRGADDPDTFTARSKLGMVLLWQARLEEAEAELRAVVAGRRRVLGSMDLDTLDARRSLAGVLFRQNRLEEAEAELRAVVAGRRLVLGGNHPDTRSAHRDLAVILAGQGRPEEAEAERQAGGDFPAPATPPP